jgi:hypothetical protein
MKAGIVLISLCAVACSTGAERSAKSFVHWDAVSDAASGAEARCQSGVELIEGRKGYSPDDYRCDFNRKDLAASDQNNDIQLPGVDDIAHIEGGFTLLNNSTQTGFAAAPSTNSPPRVKVRQVACRPVSGQGIVCAYEADACLENEVDLDADGWCTRESLLVRPDNMSPGTPSSNGWTIRRAEPRQADRGTAT